MDGRSYMNFSGRQTYDLRLWRLFDKEEATLPCFFYWRTMILLTNNENFKNKKYDSIVVKYLNEDYLKSFYMARDLIHKNYVLLTHPLYGNFRPRDTLYRSFLLKKSDSLHLDSVYLIEDSIKRVENYFLETEIREMDEAVKEDLREIDEELINEVLESLWLGVKQCMI